jgi:hypothetical protein
MPLTPQSPFYQPVLEAVLTPVVAMFVQSAFATHNGGSIRNALVHNFGWGQLFMCAVIATVVFFLIRPFAARKNCLCWFAGVLFDNSVHSHPNIGFQLK